MVLGKNQTLEAEHTSVEFWSNSTFTDAQSLGKNTARCYCAKYGSLVTSKFDAVLLQ